MRRPDRLWRWFRRDRRGALPVEMALCAPVLILLLIGTADVVWLYLARERLERAAAVIADVTARAAEIRLSDLDDTFRAAREVLAPLDLSADGRAWVSSVTDVPGLGPRIVWQRATAPGLVVASRIGTVGGAPDFAGSFTLARGESVVVGEVFLEVRPLFGLVVNGPQELYARAIQRPRYGSVTLVADAVDATRAPAASAVPVVGAASGPAKAPVSVPAASPVTRVAPAVVTPPLPANIRD